jgi:hypothetical protein
LVQTSALRPVLIAAPTADLKNDIRPICLTQFLGWLGGGAGVKYIDTQLTGNVKITFPTISSTLSNIQETFE